MAVAGRSEAGVMEHIGMYPLDTVKTHMQAPWDRQIAMMKLKNCPMVDMVEAKAVADINDIPSGYLTVRHGKSPCY